MENKANLHVNDRILLEIKRIGINGEGIGYYKKLAVFVPFCLPGEIWEVQIDKVFASYATAFKIKLKTNPSPMRVTPKCPYFEACGGCRLQHASYEVQLQIKKDMVAESFQKYFDGKLPPNMIKDPLGMSNPYRYRNKTKLPIRFDGKKLVSGLYSFDSNRLVYIDDCLIEKESIRKTLKDVLKLLSKSQVIAYNPRLKDGVLRHIILRESNLNKEMQITLILYKKDERTINIAKELLDIEPIKSVYISINADSEALETFGKNTYLLVGKKVIEESLKDKVFSLSPDAFFQLNFDQTLVLYDTVQELVGKKEDLKLVDAYCGVGSIGLYLAGPKMIIKGIDNNKAAIDDANANAALNNLSNAVFYAGSVVEHLKKFEAEGFIPDVLVVDPPRMGLELALINYLQKSKIKKIVYVSCNHATLAKNLNHLQKAYKLKTIIPVDMFPQTPNVECVVCLIRR